jgi:hypothetical protein
MIILLLLMMIILLLLLLLFNLLIHRLNSAEPIKKQAPILFFHGAAAPSGSGPHHYRGFRITLIKHTTLGRNPLDE